MIRLLPSLRAPGARSRAAAADRAGAARPLRTGLMLLALLLTAACGSSQDDADPAGYSTRAGQVLDDSGTVLQLRGINLFGFETDILIPQALDRMGWKQQLQQLQDLGFNAIRLPYVPETLYSTQRVGIELDTFVDPGLNADLIGKTPLQVLDLWMAEAERLGFYVVLDFHSVAKGVLFPLWYSDQPAQYGAGGAAPTYDFTEYTAAEWRRDLQFVATRYAAQSRFIGIDLYNEPHGAARWGEGDPDYTPANDWKLAAESAAAAVLASNPRLLVFVQGIDRNHDGIEDATLGINYGENLQAQSYRPLDIPAEKLVLFPHSYGPDALYATPKPEFAAADFPANLPRTWETLWGRFQPVAPVVLGYTVMLGEFGGYYGSGPTGTQDMIWQDALVDYLIGKDMRSAFYWCYTPNSNGTGGLLDDDLQVRTDKLAMLRRLFGT